MKRVTAAALVAITLAGCSFFGKSKSRFFSLERLPGTVIAARGTPIAIESLELPPGFDRREVVVRKANHELDIRSVDQWSAVLEPMVLHTLAFDLAGRLPEGMVVLPGETKPVTATRAIDVVIEEFSAGPESRVTLDARWVMSGASHHEQIAIDVLSLDSPNVAAGMSQALAALADRIAAGLR